MKTLITAQSFIFSFNLFADSGINIVDKIEDSPRARAMISTAAFQAWSNVGKIIAEKMKYPNGCDSLTLRAIRWKERSWLFKQSNSKYTVAFNLTIYNDCLMKGRINDLLPNPMNEEVEATCSLFYSNTYNKVFLNNCQITERSDQTVDLENIILNDFF
jgi:hypothetical protein